MKVQAVMQEALAALKSPDHPFHAAVLQPLAYLAVVELLLGLNFLMLLRFGQGYKILRWAYLLISAPVALSLVPLAIGGIAKAVCVQVAGAFFATWLRAVEYVVLDDPSPEPRTTWGYFLCSVCDTFLPFEEGGGAAVRAAGSNPAPAVASIDEDNPEQKRQRQQRREQLERLPLAAPGTSYPTAAVRLLLEWILQYFLYDILLTLVIRPLAGSGGAGDSSSSAPLQGGVALLPLLSTTSVLASLAFTVVLYLHFCLSYKGIVLVVSLAQPDLLHRCRHQFREPWRAMNSSIGELWQRWHQLFRLTFVRLAYRPARALVRYLLHTRRHPHHRQNTHGSGGSGTNGITPVGASSANGGAHAAPPDASETAGEAGATAAGAAASQKRGKTQSPSYLAAVEEAAGLLAVFVLSGIIHEYMCWAAFGAARGWQLAFFILHALAILAEQALGLGLAASASSVAAEAAGGGSGGAAVSRTRGSPSSSQRAAGKQQRARLVRVVHGAVCAVFCAATSVLFMRPWLAAGYHRDFWHPVSPVAWAVGLAGRLGRGGGEGAVDAL